MNEQELYHYGVPGMKWGVRRDARILANHRRNVEVSYQKKRYKAGIITKEQYVAAKRKANVGKKKYLSDVENQFRNAKDRDEREKLGERISNTAVKEVPNINVKRGLAVANQILGTYSVGTTAYTSIGMAAINPAFAAAYLGAGIVATAAEAGARYVNRALLDRAS